jgi:hypothetical protein
MTGISLVVILLIFSMLYVAQMIFNKSLLLKFVSITYLFAVSSGVYFSFDTYKGWPSGEKAGKGFLIYSMVIEPDDTEPGAIYYWAVTEPPESNAFEKFMTYDFGMTAPRSYYLPYSKKAASQFSEANEKIRKGFLVEINEDESEQQGGEGSQSESNKGTNKEPTGGDLEDYDVPHLSIISPDRVLRKDQQ